MCTDSTSMLREGCWPARIRGFSSSTPMARPPASATPTTTSWGSQARPGRITSTPRAILARQAPPPNPLGVMGSGDGGQSWATNSLSGEVDFHALTTDGNTLVGFDTANGIRTSTDSGVSWTDGIEIAARALAITDEGIWATTAGG